MQLNEVQAALFAVLSEATGLPVYASPAPQDAAYPYVTIGELEASAWDTDNSLGNAITVQVHTWHQGQSKLPSYAVQGAIYSALHYNDTISLSSYHLVGCICEFSTVLTEANQEIQHGVQRFLMTIEEL